MIMAQGTATNNEKANGMKKQGKGDIPLLSPLIRIEKQTEDNYIINISSKEI